MSPTSALIDQIRSGTAAYNIKEFAAQGVLPIPEEELIPLQIMLSKDEDPHISSTAFHSLQNVSEKTWSRLLEKKDPDNQILSYCIQGKFLSMELKEKILLNASISDAIVGQMASEEAGHLIDLIINNQVRLLRDTQILANLEKNDHLSIDQKRRIEEFKQDFILKKQQPVDEIEKITIQNILEQIPNLDSEALKIIKEADEKPNQQLSDEQTEQTLKGAFSVEKLSELPFAAVSTYQKILKMPFRQRLRLGLLGDREERSILIHDGNRMVASMVLRNPKITEAEMENFAQMRNIDSDILRQMGQRREFIKGYMIVLALVRNPKTPSPTSLNLLKLLRENDLRNLERDKNIPELIRRQAKKILLGRVKERG